MEHLKEVLGFLDNPNPVLLETAISYITSLTSSSEGKELVFSIASDIIPHLLRLITFKTTATAKAAAVALVNFTEDLRVCSMVLRADRWNTLVNALAEQVNSWDYKSQEDIRLIARYIAMAMSNVTRASDTLEELLRNSGYRAQADASIVKLTNLCSNQKSLHDDSDPEDVFVWIATLIMNFSSAKEGRNLLVSNTQDHLPLLSLLLADNVLQKHPNNAYRQKISGSLKNCCFLISAQSDSIRALEPFIMEEIMKTLIGSKSSYSDSDLESMPKGVKAFLDKHPERSFEADPEVQVLLLETLMMFTNSRPHRDYMRSCGIYEVLRECHKQEPNEEIKDQIHGVVEIILQDEEPVKIENDDGDEEVDGSSSSSSSSKSPLPPLGPNDNLPQIVHIKNSNLELPQTPLPQPSFRVKAAASAAKAAESALPSSEKTESNNQEDPADDDDIVDDLVDELD